MELPTLVCGEVVKVTARQETKIRGGSAGGFVGTINGRVIGYNSPTYITSRTILTDLVWIKISGSNVEREFRFEGDTFPCRETHVVSIIASGDRLIFAKNFGSGKSASYYTDAQLSALIIPKQESHLGQQIAGGSLFLLGLLMIAAAMSDHKPGAFFFAIALFGGGSAMIYLGRKKTIDYERRNKIGARSAKDFLVRLTDLKNSMEEKQPPIIA